MIESHTLASIIEKLDSELPRKIRALKNIEPTLSTMGYVTTLDTHQPLKNQTIEIELERKSKLVGLLFSHPESKLAQEEIIKHLPHFHLRSGNAVDFFCIGYGAFWPPNHHLNTKNVVTIEGVDWLFSEEAFSNVIDELQQESKWEYSGETDLILVSAVKDQSGNTYLDFDNAIVCNLEGMSKDNAFTSVRSFFTGLFKYAKSHSASDPTWGLSDAQGATIAKSALKDAVLSLLPASLKDSYKKAEHYAVRNISLPKNR